MSQKIELIILQSDGTIRMPYAGHFERVTHRMTIDLASIGLRIKHARNRRSLTQEQLADAVGISWKHLSVVESAGTGISLELLIALANTLEVPVGELLADNLSAVDKIDDSDLGYILLDCTAQEEKIITKTAKALKAILSEHGV